MDRIAGFLVLHGRRVLALTGVLTLVSLAMLFRMSFNADLASAVLDGSEAGRDFAALQDKYDTGDPINVLVTTPEGSTFGSGAVLADLLELTEELRAMDGVVGVASVVPETHPITGAAITASSLKMLPDIAVQRGLLANPMADLLVSEDRRSTIVMVMPEGDGFDLARSLIEWEEAGGGGDLDLVLSGNPVIFASVLGMLSWFMLAIPPAVLILLLGTFFLTIGDRKLAIFAILPALLGSIWTFGVIFGLGVEVDLLTILVPIFVIVMGSADGLHFVTHFQEEVSRTADPGERVASTLRQIGVPMILTTISTAAGFLSLLVADVRPIQQLGLFTAIGIGFAGLISFFFLPVLLLKAKVQPTASKAVLGPRVLRLLRWLAARRVFAAALVVLLVAFSAVFIPKLEVNSDQLYMFRPDHPIRVDFAKIEAALGGATPLTGEFAFDRAAGLEGLERVREVSRELEALPGVRKVFSLADLAGTVEQTSAERAEALLSGDFQSPLGKMVSEDGLRFVLFPGAFETEDLERWLAFVEENDEVRAITGLPILWDSIARSVLRAQVRSLAAAFVMVVLMLAIAYRRVRETLISLLPLVLTIATLLGFLAASGTHLTMVSATVSAIVLGVGIDYAIHFVAALDHARPDGPGWVPRAIDKAGRPIMANALGIAIGMTALWLSPFGVHPQISMIMWVSMTTAALTSILVISALSPREGRETAPTSAE
jgi:uncharacterized protein